MYAKHLGTILTLLTQNLKHAQPIKTGRLVKNLNPFKFNPTEL